MKNSEWIPVIEHCINNDIISINVHDWKSYINFKKCSWKIISIDLMKYEIFVHIKYHYLSEEFKSEKFTACVIKYDHANAIARDMKLNSLGFNI